MHSVCTSVLYLGGESFLPFIALVTHPRAQSLGNECFITLEVKGKQGCLCVCAQVA